MLAVYSFIPFREAQIEMRVLPVSSLEVTISEWMVVCSFSRCLSVGLKAEQVVENVDRFLDEGDRSLLSNCRLFYRGTFVSRRRNHIQMFGTEVSAHPFD